MKILVFTLSQITVKIKMSLTIHDLFDRLKELDELSILEILNISSEDLISKFQYEIEDKFDNLVVQFEDENDTFLDR